MRRRSGLRRLIDDLTAGEPPESSPSGELPEDDLADPRNRRIRVCGQHSNSQTVEGMSVDEARGTFALGLERYREIPNPAHVLLVKAGPGVGKSTEAAWLAEMVAAEGKRVLWLAPRHDMFPDLQALARHPSWWYEWMPRQTGDPETREGETCMYARQVNSWLNRGYQGMHFCAAICGWDYVNKRCTYHRQAQQPEPIIVGQHPHIWGGHPLEFSLAIGDESPLGTFAHEWLIPLRYIVPPGMPLDQEITQVLHDLYSLAEQDLRLEGPALLAALGGASRVWAACNAAAIPIDAIAAPDIHRAEDAEHAPYFHLPNLVNLLQREALAAISGEYPHRVVVANHKLILLLRRRVIESMPKHLIWLDATGDPELYEEMLGRPVETLAPEVEFRGRVYQVHDSANGKGAMLEAVQDEKGKPVVNPNGEVKKQPTVKASRMRRQADTIAERHPIGRTAVVTHLALLDQFQDWPGSILHFYAARGTNQLQDCDALVVIGTPMPQMDEIEKLARMIWWKRMKPFRTGVKLDWQVQWRQYEFADAEGGREIPVGNFADPDLALLLYQLRDAEVLQAAHRARPNLREIDIWLLTNLPVAGLPPTRLLSVRELFNAPEHMDPYTWPRLKALAEEHETRSQPLYSSEVATGLGVSQDSAVRYLDILVRDQPTRWTWPDDTHIVPVRGRGAPAKAILPRGGQS